jgi:hypothetical protein
VALHLSRKYDMPRSGYVLFSVVGFAFLTSVALTDDPKPGTEIGNGITIPSNHGIATNISHDGQAATIIFDNLVVDVGPAVKSIASTSNQTAIQTKVLTVNVPYATDQSNLKFTMDIRGIVDHDWSSSTRLIACAGDKTKIVDLSTSKTR